MRVQVNEAGRDDEVCHVDRHGAGWRIEARTHGDDHAITHCDISDSRRRATPVDDPATAKEERAAAIRSHS